MCTQARLCLWALRANVVNGLGAQAVVTGGPRDGTNLLHRRCRFLGPQAIPTVPCQRSGLGRWRREARLEGRMPMNVTS